MGLRESILNSPNAGYTKLPFDVPEWSLTKDNATILTMSALDRFVWESERESNNPNISAIFITLILGNEKGEKLFTLDDANEIAKKDWRILDRLVVEGLKANSLTQKDADDLSKK